jgi:hypothetical protein
VILSNYYWYFQSAIPARICDDIVRYGKQLQDQMAVTGGYGKGKNLNQKQIKDLKQKRDSNIVWMDDRLQNTKKVNFMIGIVMVGINLILENIQTIHHMVKLESCL